jgi:peptidoglycan/LPS O-acetylase OafA/YrhL
VTSVAQRAAVAKDNAARIPSLDGIRGVAIVLVLFDHTLVSFRGYSNGSFLSEFGSAVGSLGVNVFFVLSGFLITMLLLRERAVSGRIDLRRFYVRRTQRIFPAFYIYLAIVGALCTFGTLAQIRPFDLAFDFLYLHNFGLGVGNWYVGQTWSLDIEEQFYLVWPAIAILGWRFYTFRDREHRRRTDRPYGGLRAPAARSRILADLDFHARRSAHVRVRRGATLNARPRVRSVVFLRSRA